MSAATARLLTCLSFFLLRPRLAGPGRNQYFRSEDDTASTVADDDGGYIRMMAQAYYANPLPLP